MSRDTTETALILEIINAVEALHIWQKNHHETIEGKRVVDAIATYRKNYLGDSK
jgi:predicted transcriptional regulator